MRIFLVHPFFQSMQLMQAAFRRDWPEVGTFNLLDESLYAEMDEAGTITPEIIRRIRLLFEYCVSARADAIVFTGTTFGPAVDVVRGPLIVPVVRADEALERFQLNPGRILRL